MKTLTILAIGETPWDLLPTGRLPGGAPANFACPARAADSPPVDGRVGRESIPAGSPVDRGEQAGSRRQDEVFRELIQGCARAGAGSLTPLHGGVRYLSADGTVMVTIADRRWL